MPISIILLAYCFKINCKYSHYKQFSAAREPTDDFIIYEYIVELQIIYLPFFIW